MSDVGVGGVRAGGLRTGLVTWRHLRGPRRWRPSLADSLVATAAAAVVAVVVLAAGANAGLSRRSDASAWRLPVAARGEATAVQALGVEHVGGHRVVEVAYAVLADGAPVPPGIDHAPGPGEAFLSPALARLVTADPVVAARFPMETGRIGDAALEHPGELVAVEGFAPDDPTVTEARVVPSERRQFVVGPVAINAANTQPKSDDLLAGYRLLLAIATVLVVVPALTVAGGAARLLARRRAGRLSTLRLLGARPSQVAVVATAETSRVAVVGAIVGLGLGLALLPVLARVPVAGGRAFPGTLVPPWGWCAVVVGAVPLVVVASTLTALGPVVRAPLATVRRSQPGRARAVRVALLAVAVVTFPLTLDGFGSDVGLAMAAWGALLVGLSVTGPFVVRLLGRALLRCGRGARSMLAARRLLDDPRAAFRLVSPLVLPAFVAGVLAIAAGAIASLGATEDDVLVVARRADTGRADAAVVEAALAEEGIGATVSVGEPSPVELDLGGPVTVDARTIEVWLDDPLALEHARTVVADVLPGSLPATPAEDDHQPAVMSGDFPRGSRTMLVGVGALAATATGLALASTALDERDTLAALRALGVPLGVVADSCRRSVVLPFLVCAVGAAGLGALCGAWMLSSIGRYPIDGSWPIGLGLTLGACLVMLLVAEAATRPLLAAVSAEPGRFADT